MVDDRAEALRGVLSGVIETHPLGAVFDISVYDDTGSEALPRWQPPASSAAETGLNAKSSAATGRRKFSPALTRCF